MAIRKKIGRVSGTLESMNCPITVWDDTGASMSESTAVVEALLVAPEAFFGNLVGVDPDIDQLSRSAYRINLRYSKLENEQQEEEDDEPELSIDYRFNFQAKDKFVKYAEDSVGVFTKDGPEEIGFQDMRFLVNVERVNGVLRWAGAQVQPLAETFTLDYVAPNVNITSAYQLLVAELCGAFNDSTFRGLPAGTCQLVRVSGAKRTEADWGISFGFGYEAARTNVDIGGGITIPTLRACDFISSLNSDQKNSDRPIVETAPYVAFVQQVWPLDDLNDLDLPDS